jgi:hypothetical protein
MKGKAPEERGRPLEAKASSVTLSPEQLRGLDGSYYSEELNVTYKLAVEGTTLRLKEIGGSSAFIRGGLLPSDSFSGAGNDVFQLHDLPLSLHFQRESDDRVKGFLLDAGRVQGIFFAKTSKN